MQSILEFPIEQYSVESLIALTGSGNRRVEYKSYMHIPYVANPIDTDFQRMDIRVPIKVDGEPVDASNAPVLFVVGVGGYMSCRNQGEQKMPPPPPGGPNGTGGPPGPPVERLDCAPRSTQDRALAAGYVVVFPGCRGRDNQWDDGCYYGKAPAAIVDLKAAIRYLRYNSGKIPGNMDYIITVGGSAGGALSALLGASGDSALYQPYLDEIGAAPASDRVLASACFCPITDLDHADMCYEWQYGQVPYGDALVDQTVSGELLALFQDYQNQLNFIGHNGFTITADNLGSYIIKEYLAPAAELFLKQLDADARQKYLKQNPWLHWDGTHALFLFHDYAVHAQRSKPLPAFDDFCLTRPEPNLFGSKTEDSRHFTDFSLQKQMGDATAKLPEKQRKTVQLMNAMYFIRSKHPGCAENWWIRHGTSDSDTSLAVIINLTLGLENLGKHVNTKLYWDAEHGKDEDSDEFIKWISRL